MKKIYVLFGLIITTTLSACSTPNVSCGEGTIAVGNTCEVKASCESNETYDQTTNTCELEEVPTCDEGFSFDGDACVLETVNSSIIVVSSMPTQLDIGSTLPDFSEYFTLAGTQINNSMIEHNLLLDSNNVLTTAGVYEVTLTVGSESKTITILVSDSSVDYNDIITEGVAGLYIDSSKKTTFAVGDYFPGFISYFIAYDGENFIPITPDLVMHNILMSADNRMIQAGSYKVWVERSIAGVEYFQEIPLTVEPIGNATVESIGDTGWEIQNDTFTESNLYDKWMVPTGDVNVTYENGEVDIHVNNVGMNFWDVLFAQPGKTFEKGYTYTITYRMKTGLPNGRDVVVFVEPAPQAVKLLEEHVSLTTTYQDFSFDFTSTSNTSKGMVGVFIGANLPGAHPGSIMIDSITMTRTGEPIPDQLFEDLENPLFTNSDISMWKTEGQVTVSHNEEGYLEATVNGFTGAFYQDNIQLGGYFIRANITYTIEIIMKTDITNGRDVTFFIEDTDNNFSKYIESELSLTTAFQTFTYTFTPTVDNDDTKIGLFLGNINSAELGTIFIDKIIITPSN
jgi:hypothetical protein